MKFLVFALLVATVAGAPVEHPHEEPEPIISQAAQVNPDGSWSNQFETAKGISVVEEGVLKDFGNGESAVISHGSYAYTDKDGHPQEYKWTADENGFQVQSDALPTTPKVPEAIVKSLEWNAAHPLKDEPEIPKKF